MPPSQQHSRSRSRWISRTHTVNRDWDSPPRYCDECKERYAAAEATCEHCSKSFTIPTGTQIKCKEKGWDLPKRCEACRELFRHKPFKTHRETDFWGKTVFRTYNGIGQLIAESRDEVGFFGDERRRHRSATGETTGVTRERTDSWENKYRETRDAAGGVHVMDTDEPHSCAVPTTVRLARKS